jgi:hypothetical protein
MSLFKQKIKSILFLLLFALFSIKQQAQVTINGATVININSVATGGSPCYFVLNNPPATPITTIGTTGGIMMETEYSVTQYNLNLLTTDITIPYYSKNSGAGVQFPLAVTAISGAAAAGAANLQFSSTNAIQGSHIGTTAAFGSGYDNVNYMPTTVNNMNGYNPPPTFIADNSLNAIDRFWVIAESGYTTSPAVTLDFGYVTAEAAVNGGNTAGLAANLEAMAFDQGALTWGNYGPIGVNTTGASEGNVGSVSVGAGKIGAIFRSWTLVNHLSPLPVDLLNFSGICYGNINANLIWSTAIETNSSFFTIEKSTDGQNFTWLANINAVGNSTHKQNYSYVDISDIGAVTYYRLSETDINGAKKVFNTIVVNGCDENLKENITTYSNNGNINFSVYSLSNQPVHIVVYDVTGRLIYKDDLSAVQGDNNFSINPSVANGIYVVQAETNLASLVERVPIIK